MRWTGRPWTGPARCRTHPTLQVVKSLSRCGSRVHRAGGGQPLTLLRLPDLFAEDMEDLVPLGLRLQPDGRCNRPSLVATDFNSLSFLFLRRGWKSFTLDQGLWDGHVLHFKLDRATTLFVKVFRSAGGRMDCSMKDRGGGPSDIDDNGNNSSSDGSGGDTHCDGSVGACVKEEAESD
ncbi:l-ascorbate oxidase-like protein [Hordeum vulgare]|nr:l-ascorbate oxidase-like protein [Hordeum vulgare]